MYENTGKVHALTQLAEMKKLKDKFKTFFRHIKEEIKHAGTCMMQKKTILRGNVIQPNTYIAK